jgi:hypothetical protein
MRRLLGPCFLALLVLLPVAPTQAEVIWWSFLPSQLEDLPGVGVNGNRIMTYIGFQNNNYMSRIYARMNDEAKYKIREEGPSTVVLEIQNATIPILNNRRFLDTSYFDSPVTMITPTVIDDISPHIRIVVEIRQQMPYTVKIEGQDIVLIFNKTNTAQTAPSSTGPSESENSPSNPSTETGLPESIPLGLPQ